MIEMSSNSAAVPALWYPQSEQIVYEFTRETGLLRQYFGLYREECRIANGAKYRAADEDQTRRAHVLIARIGSKCIGGCRLSIRSEREAKPLPMETEQFQLEDHFPRLKRPGSCYGEISRLVLIPAFRNGRASLEMWKRFCQRTVDLAVDVMFAAAPLINLRAYRKHCHSIGLDATIHRDVVVPPEPGFEHITDYVLSCAVRELKSSRGTEAQELRH
jgi:hypothetical protein